MAGWHIITTEELAQKGGPKLVFLCKLAILPLTEVNSMRIKRASRQFAGTNFAHKKKFPKIVKSH